MFPYLPGIGESSWIQALILTASSLVGLIYFVKVIWPKIKGSLFKEKKSAEERTHNLMREFRKAEFEDFQRHKPLETPRIKALRGGRKDGAIVCLFINQGGEATDLHVLPRGAFEARIEPEGVLQAGDMIKVTLSGFHGHHESQYQFDVQYKNSIAETTSEHYSFSSTGGLRRLHSV